MLSHIDGQMVDPRSSRIWGKQTNECPSGDMQLQTLITETRPPLRVCVGVQSMGYGDGSTGPYAPPAITQQSDERSMRVAERLQVRAAKSEAAIVDKQMHIYCQGERMLCASLAYQ